MTSPPPSPRPKCDGKAAVKIGTTGGTRPGHLPHVTETGACSNRGMSSRSLRFRPLTWVALAVTAVSIVVAVIYFTAGIRSTALRSSGWPPWACWAPGSHRRPNGRRPASACPATPRCAAISLLQYPRQPPHDDGKSPFVPGDESRPLEARRPGFGGRSVDRPVIAIWPMPGGRSPDMGGVSADGTKLGLSGRYVPVVYVFDTTAGQVRRKIPVSPGRHGLVVWPQPGRSSSNTGATPAGRPGASAPLATRQQDPRDAQSRGGLWFAAVSR